MKGQLTIYGLVACVIAAWLYLAILDPYILAPAINTYILYLQANPGQFTDMLAILAQLSRVVLLLAILISAWHYATPRVQTYQPPY